LLFNSFLFAAFFAVVFALHRFLPHRGRNLLLLAASYVFYASWDWRFVPLLAGSTALSFAAGLFVASTDDARRRRLGVLVCAVGNLGVLAFFKYWGFFLEGLDALLGALGTSAAALHLDLILPLGLAFYTLQGVGYVVDVYRREMEPVRDPLDFALFISFFPQLVAGPIERAPRLIPQIQQERRITRDDLHEGAALAGWGLLKKVVIADHLALVVDPIYAPDASPAGLAVLVGTWAFTFQLYADFSAYTDMARGTARMLGFQLMRNFDVPYFSNDMREFWRRWHISLSSWLRDYLYIPLGGSRRGEGRTALNLFLTLLISGLWHGSNGTFAWFGALNGLWVIAVRFAQRRGMALGPRWLGALIAVQLWAATLVFFRAETVEQAFGLFRSLSLGFWWEAALLGDVLVLAACAAALLGFDALHWRQRTDLFVLGWPGWARVSAYAGALAMIALFGRGDAVDFVYFQF
jgi:alginate O-acetyltransferase complex protein AlgI